MTAVILRAALAMAFGTVWMAAGNAGAPAPRPEMDASEHLPAHQVANIGPFQFQNGEVLEEFKVSYITYGTLNESGDNVILALQAFTGDHHHADFLVGPGKAIDTNTYFVVAPDFISNGLLRHDLTTGPTNSGLKMGFPNFSILDSVNVDVKLLREYLGISRIRAAIGCSIGAMKSYQLAVSHPEFAQAIIPMAGSAKINPQMQLQLYSAMRIIEEDPNWRGGDYNVNPIDGVVASLLSFGSWWYSPEWYAANLVNSEDIVEYDAFWRGIWEGPYAQDARDVYHQMRHWAEFDLGDSPGFDGDTAAALGSIRSRMLLISVATDVMVLPQEIAFVRENVPNVVHMEMDHDSGHVAACGLDQNATDEMTPVIADFLDAL